MDKKPIFGLLAVGVLTAVLVVVPNRADAHPSGAWGSYEDYRRPESRSDWNKLRRDRAALRRDQAELERDRTDLRRLYERGASRAAIERKKAEIRRDLREIREGRREVWESYSALRRDRYDNDRRYDNRRDWRRDDRGGWGWGNGWWGRYR